MLRRNPATDTLLLPKILLLFSSKVCNLVYMFRKSTFSYQRNRWIFSAKKKNQVTGYLLNHKVYYFAEDRLDQAQILEVKGIRCHTISLTCGI